MIAVLKKKGVALPPMESEEGLATKEIMDKIRSFYFRLEKSHGEICEFAESCFLELLHHYPKSICGRHTSENQKMLMALFYCYGKDVDDEKPLFSYESLSIMFDVSKATVHTAIKEKEEEAKAIIKQATFRKKARSIALEELVKEEKEKLKNEKTEERQLSK